jgi:hypothetical protein
MFFYWPRSLASTPWRQRKPFSGHRQPTQRLADDASERQHSAGAQEEIGPRDDLGRTWLRPTARGKQRQERQKTARRHEPPLMVAFSELAAVADAIHSLAPRAPGPARRRRRRLYGPSRFYPHVEKWATHRRRQAAPSARGENEKCTNNSMGSIVARRQSTFSRIDIGCMSGLSCVLYRHERRIRYCQTGNHYVSHLL